MLRAPSRTENNFSLYFVSPVSWMRTLVLLVLGALGQSRPSILWINPWAAVFGNV